MMDVDLSKYQRTVGSLWCRAAKGELALSSYRTSNPFAVKMHCSLGSVQVMTSHTFYTQLATQ